MADLASITPPLAEANTDYKPYARDPETLARKWAVPGTEGLRHRIGGLEKTDIFGQVSTDPMNHEKMVKYRAEKVKRIENYIPEQEVYGDAEGDLLVVSWGGTAGALRNAVEKARIAGMNVSHAHFRYINPLPKNTREVLARYKKVLVCELNNGQFVNYLRMNFPEIPYLQYNKIQGLPFTVIELVEKFNQIAKEA
jgi:2-oxoglutarate ferredoxin oxidoreductase subunit alpha